MSTVIITILGLIAVFIYIQGSLVIVIVCKSFFAIFIDGADIPEFLIAFIRGDVSILPYPRPGAFV